MAAENFFDLITRYSQRPARDPGENRLTAIVTAVMQQQPDLASAVLREFVPALSDLPTLETETQVPVRLANGRYGFVDLVLRGDELTVWVEVKRTSGRSGPDQFDKYAATLQEYPSGRRALLVLAPAQMRTQLGTLKPAKSWASESPVEALWVSLEDLHKALCRFDPGDDQWLSWALEETRAYLELEGFAFMPVNEKHVAALDTIDEARQAVVALVDNVQSALAESLGEGTRDVDEPNYAELRYDPAKFAPDVPWHDGAQLSWGVDTTEIFAGIASGPAAAPLQDMSNERIESWLAARKAEASSGGRVEADWVWRVLPLREVAAVEDPAEQVRCVTEFVKDSLIALVEAARDA